jgi:hypothetical protein
MRCLLILNLAPGDWFTCCLIDKLYLSGSFSIRFNVPERVLHEAVLSARVNLSLDWRWKSSQDQQREDQKDLDSLS